MAEDPKRRAVEGVADTIRRAILTGGYRAGQRLPAERELSEELGVSRLTLRAALARLETEGLLKPMHGSGTVVLDYREHGGVDLLGHLAQLALGGAAIEGGLDVFASLLELRRAVAIEALGLAAERATPEELRAMRDHVDMLEKLLGDSHAFMVADLAFARMIVRATRNLAFELLFNTVVRTVEGNPAMELAFFANAATTVKIYRRLLDQMDARGADRARATASRLLHRLDRTTIDALTLFFAAGAAARAAAPEPPEAPTRARARKREPGSTKPAAAQARSNSAAAKPASKKPGSTALIPKSAQASRSTRRKTATKTDATKGRKR